MRVASHALDLNLPPEYQALVKKARSFGLLDMDEVLGYLSPDLCTLLSLLLALPTLGYSLLLVPIVWVAQSERTNTRLNRLRQAVARIESGSEVSAAATAGAVNSGMEQEMTAQLT